MRGAHTPPIATVDRLEGANVHHGTVQVSYDRVSKVQFADGIDRHNIAKATICVDLCKILMDGVERGYT